MVLFRTSGSLNYCTIFDTFLRNFGPILTRNTPVTGNVMFHVKCCRTFRAISWWKFFSLLLQDWCLLRQCRVGSAAFWNSKSVVVWMLLTWNSFTILPTPVGFLTKSGPKYRLYGGRRSPWSLYKEWGYRFFLIRKAANSISMLLIALIIIQSISSSISLSLMSFAWCLCLCWWRFDG